MSEVFDRVAGSGEIIPVLAITAVFGSLLVISLTAIISRCVYKVCRDSNAAHLKQDMLDRGMSADEIKTVLEAGPK